MDTNDLIVGGIGFFICFFGFLGLTIFIFLFRKVRMMTNPLDIIVLDITSTGMTTRFEIGRQEIETSDPNMNKRTVTCALFPKSIKDHLGYQITDEDMSISNRGRGRKLLIVAMKDKVPISLRYTINRLPENEAIAQEKIVLKKLFSFGSHKDFSAFVINKAEKQKIADYLARTIQPVRFPDFNVDTSFAKSDAADIYKKTHTSMMNLFLAKKEEKMKELIKWVVVMVIVTVLVCAGIFVATIWLAPEGAQKVASIGAMAVHNVTLPPS